jgi:Reverse transcriptase (RNA-dependent DNA polymerase)/RNase H-like domain found in reverse transcriptase
VKPKQFPLTSSKNFFNESSKFKIFCVIDIQNAFLSIPLTENAKKLLAIITPFGTFLPQRTPFGLKTSPSAFCYAINQVIGDLPFIQYYMDDILVGGHSDSNLVDNLIVVMGRLYQYNLKIRLSKTSFFVKEVKVLGVIFTANGKRIDPAKIKAIKEFGPIDTLKKVQTFLGMLAFVSSFISHFSTVCHPLYSLLKDQNNKKFELTVEAEAAYEAIKNSLCEETILYHPNFEQNLYLRTDASNVGCGSFLYQIDCYEKSEKGKQEMLQKLGFIPEQQNTKFLVSAILSLFVYVCHLDKGKSIIIHGYDKDQCLQDDNRVIYV